MTYFHVNQCSRYYVSMLLSLILANIRILLCFFFLLFVVFDNIFIIPVAKENTMVNPALAIPTGVPATAAWEIIQTPPVAALKAIKILSM